jgi:hypothetical protein
MKSQHIIPALLLSGLALGAQAENYLFVAQDKSPETQICISAGSDEMPKLRRQLVNDSDSLRFSINSIYCNGLSLTQFAYRYGAMDAFGFLTPHTRTTNRVEGKVTIQDISAATDKGQFEDETVLVYVSAH